MSRRKLQVSGRFAVVAGAALFLAGALGAAGDAVVHAQAGGKPMPTLDVKKPYQVTVSAVAAKPGQPGTATVTIKSATGYHLNKDFPTQLKLSPPAGVTTPKPVLRREDGKFGENEGSFSVSLAAAAAGKLTVPAELRFAVCTDTTCEPQREQIAIAMEVK